ncbi:hypothetical protein, partial [Levilactobacillus brevis]|uniref:hypothetical protein n=1 Tax=Levilactobacillus brevis TaxID=1580 RepID=UPI0021A6A80C
VGPLCMEIWLRVGKAIAKYLDSKKGPPGSSSHQNKLSQTLYHKRLFDGGWTDDGSRTDGTI